MNPWRDVLKIVQAELDRLSQEIGGRAVLPNGIHAALPASRFEKWAPILEAVTAELGAALVEWVGGSRRAWYNDLGPFLTVRLDGERAQPEIVCEFLKTVPGESPATREEASVGGVADGSSWRAESTAGSGEAVSEPVPAEPLAVAEVESVEVSEEAVSIDPLEIDAGLSEPVIAELEGVEDPEDEDFHLSRIELG